jgi:hypothetical protein
VWDVCIKLSLLKSPLFTRAWRNWEGVFVSFKYLFLHIVINNSGLNLGYVTPLKNDLFVGITIVRGGDFNARWLFYFPSLLVYIKWRFICHENAVNATTINTDSAKALTVLSSYTHFKNQITYGDKSQKHDKLEEYLLQLKAQSRSQLSKKKKKNNSYEAAQVLRGS